MKPLDQNTMTEIAAAVARGRGCRITDAPSLFAVAGVLLGAIHEACERDDSIDALEMIDEYARFLGDLPHTGENREEMGAGYAKICGRVLCESESELRSFMRLMEPRERCSFCGLVDCACVDREDP